MKKTSIKHLSFVGSGNVATHLALALNAAGCAIDQICSPHIAHAAALAAQVGAAAIADPAQLGLEADAYIIAVNDDALYALAQTLRIPNALVIHTSGSTPLDVILPISPRCGVLWSPQTFVRTVAMDYTKLPLCIEASTVADEEALRHLCQLISPTVYTLTGPQRQWAHLAAVMASNFGNALNAISQDLMQEHGLDFAMLRPLIEATAHKAEHGPLWPQQTGPAIRHDDQTLAQQRSLLADRQELLQLYNLLTEIIQSK